MNQLYGNRKKIKLVRERTQNTKLRLNNTKQKKGGNSRGAGKKSLHKPLCKARITKANWIKHERKPKGCKLEGSRMEKHCTRPMLVRQNTQRKDYWIKQNKHKHAINLTGAEGVALHKPDVCEAKHAKQKITVKAKLATSMQQTLRSRGNSAAQSRCLWGKARKRKLLNKAKLNTSVQQTLREPRE